MVPFLSKSGFDSAAIHGVTTLPMTCGANSQPSCLNEQGRITSQHLLSKESTPAESCSACPVHNWAQCNSFGASELIRHLSLKSRALVKTVTRSPQVYHFVLHFLFTILPFLAPAVDCPKQFSFHFHIHCMSGHAAT